MDPLSGKTVRWTFAGGPSAGTTFEHTFHPDGSVTWSIADGPHRGASAREKSYAAVKLNDKTLAVSYLAASGHTLTVLLSVDDGQMFGVASSEKEWYAMKGTFAFVTR